MLEECNSRRHPYCYDTIIRELAIIHNKRCIRPFSILETGWLVDQRSNHDDDHTRGFVVITIIICYDS